MGMPMLGGRWVTENGNCELTCVQNEAFSLPQIVKQMQFSRNQRGGRFARADGLSYRAEMNLTT